MNQTIYLGNMTYKRYQYWSSEGIQWCDWFPYDGEKYKWQLKNKLLNEYKDGREEGIN